VNALSVSQQEVALRRTAGDVDLCVRHAHRVARAIDERAASIARVTLAAEHWIAAIAALCAASALGCAATGASGGTTPPPSGTLTAWSRAVAANDVDAAWALLDVKAHEGIDEARFRVLFAENRAELAAQAQAMATRAATPVTAQARVALVDGEVVVLVLEDDVWRIDGGVLDAPGLRTPEDAVASLRRALQRRSLSGVLRVLARSTRGDVEAELARLLDATEDPADLSIEVQGDSAEVRLTGGARIRLVRESGEWHVVDVD